MTKPKTSPDDKQDFDTYQCQKMADIPSLDPNSKTYSLGLLLDRTWQAPGVRLEWIWHGQYFYGKAEPLIAGGVAEAHWFPADWKQRKLTADGRSITVRRKSKYGFEIYVEYTPEEAAQEDARFDLARKKERELKAEEERIEKEEGHLAELPKTAEEFRTRQSNIFYGATNLLIKFCHTENGFRFDQDTILELQRINAEMAFCLQHGRVVFDPEVQASAVAKLKAARARIDPNFQAMLGRLKRPSTLPE